MHDLWPILLVPALIMGHVSSEMGDNRGHVQAQCPKKVTLPGGGDIPNNSSFLGFPKRKTQSTLVDIHQHVLVPAFMVEESGLICSMYRCLMQLMWS